MTRERMHGRILSVWTENPGTVLTADAAANTTVLVVDDVSAFNGASSDDGPGGTLQVGDQVVAYTDIDDDASTITLAAPLPTAVTLASEDYDVLVWNDLYNQLDTVQRALVQPEGKRDQADAIEAVVADEVTGLVDFDRGGPGEHCELVRDGDEWELTKVRGRPVAAKASSPILFTVDRWTMADTSDQDLSLSQLPIAGSEHVYWNGIYQPTPQAWTRDGQVLHLVGANSQVGDDIAIRYAYTPGIVTPPAIPDPAPVGPQYLINVATAPEDGKWGYVAKNWGPPAGNADSPPAVTLSSTIFAPGDPYFVDYASHATTEAVVLPPYVPGMTINLLWQGPDGFIGVADIYCANVVVVNSVNAPPGQPYSDGPGKAPWNSLGLTAYHGTEEATFGQFIKYANFTGSAAPRVYLYGKNGPRPASGSIDYIYTITAVKFLVTYPAS